MSKPLAKAFNCPTEFALSVLGGKWKTILLAYLSERPCSYAELRRLVPKLSDKVLSERLRDLERSGLIVRDTQRGTSRRRTYQLTPRGRSLEPVLRNLYAWGEEHAAAFRVEVGTPLHKLDGSPCAA